MSEFASTRILTRVVIFTLAFLSFACLLGQFYGLWGMHWFGCWVLLPATLILILIAAIGSGEPKILSPRRLIVEGALGGIVAALAYDLYRLPFVLTGTPLFKVFPRFGELLLGAIEPRWVVYLLGWSYHFSNGAALGIMFLAIVGTANPRVLFVGAIAWAMGVEISLLLTRYTAFLGLRLDAWFIFLTVSAHAIFGIVLGLWCCFRLRLSNATQIVRP